jgi:hypothetical protein
LFIFSFEGWSLRGKVAEVENGVERRRKERKKGVRKRS